MGLFKEFRDFIVKGNAFDLAVGIIIGAAFGALVNSLVKDVMMPPMGAIMGGLDFADKQIEIVRELHPGDRHPLWRYTVSKDIPAVALAYGRFINALIALVIQGFAIFLAVKLINRLRRQEPPAAAEPSPMPEDVKLLAEIRDLLKSRP